MTALRFKTTLLLAAAVFAACTKKSEEPLELKVHYPKVQVTLDPHRMEDAYSMMINNQLYRGLLRFNPTGDVVPDLAASWTESADRKKYRFKLKPLTFSNGERVTAKNVVISFARLFLLGSGMSADIDYIKGSEGLLKSKNLTGFGVKAISDDEVEFELKNPSALFLTHMAVADCAIFSFKTLDEINGASSYSGPYKLDSQKNGAFNLSKWRSDSLDSLRPPQRISFFANENADPFNLAQSGKTDSLDRDFLTSEQMNELKKNNWGASPTEITSETFIILNPKYLSAELRKYLYLKTDPSQIVALLGDPHFKAAYGLIPTGFRGELSLNDVTSLKKETPAYKGEKVSFKFDFDPCSKLEEKIAIHLKEIWSSPKIEVVLNPTTKSEKLQRMFSKTSEAVLGRKGIDYPDGFSVLTYFKGKYESNYFHVNDPKIDSGITDSVKEFDVLKRTELYRSLQLQILTHFTIIPVFFGSQASGFWSGKVQEVPSHPMGYHTMHFETIQMRNK